MSPRTPRPMATAAASALARGSASVARPRSTSAATRSAMGTAAGQGGGEADDRADDDQHLGSDVEDVHGAPEQRPQGGALARVLPHVGGDVEQGGEYDEDHGAHRDQAHPYHLERPPPIGGAAHGGGEADDRAQREGHDQPARQVGGPHEEVRHRAL